MKILTWTTCSARLFFVAVVTLAAPVFASTSDKVQTSCASNDSSLDLRATGWPEVQQDILRWKAEGASHSAHDDDDDLPTDAALNKAFASHLAVGEVLVRPDVWGSAGDGGYYIEQHDAGGRVVMLWIDASGNGRLSIFVGGTRQGEARII